MKVEEKRAVALRYKLVNSKGEVLEDILAGPAINYLHGSGTILPSLEAELEGLEVGDKKVIKMLDEDGNLTEAFKVEVVIDGVRSATEKELIAGKIDAWVNEDCGVDCDC